MTAEVREAASMVPYSEKISTLLPHSLEAQLEFNCNPTQSVSISSKSGELKLNEKKHECALNKLSEIDPEAANKLINSMKDISPDLARYAIDFPFGEIFSRPGLDLRSRELINVAALTALGNAVPQLKFHINGAMNVGCSRTEIIETIIQMAVYSGFPSALNGMTAAKEVFETRDSVD